MSADQSRGEQVLITTTDVARELFGDRLSAVFALGSLAHGGFAPLASDIDIALILHEITADTADLAAHVKQTAVTRSADLLAERLSIFWSDWEGVRRGADDRSRLPQVDRLDLLDAGRLLHGVDQRPGAGLPEQITLVLEGAEFACEKFDDAYLATLSRPDQLIDSGPRAATKAALFPVRFLYTLTTGRIGHNADAARWYQETGAHPELATAAMTWREHGIDDVETATGILRTHLVGVYEEFLEAHRNALAGSHPATATRLSERLAVLHRLTDSVG